ncbi:MAG: tetratricopeptide repeat protein [Pseudomonadota bacterium]
MDTIGIGLIGTGFMGKAHALAYRSVRSVMGDVPATELVMLCDTPLDKAEAMASLEMKLGGVYHRRGDWGLAAGHYQQALGRTDDDGQRARLLTDWSRTAHRGGDGEQALELAEEALALAESAEDRKALPQAHNILGILANSRDQWDLAQQHLQQSLAMAGALGGPGIKIAARNNLALALRAAGEMERAVALVQEALGLCVELGDRHREAALRNNLADLLHAAGNSAESMAQLKQAVTIYAEIDGDASQWRPEIWKLSEW